MRLWWCFSGNEHRAVRSASTAHMQWRWQTKEILIISQRQASQIFQLRAVDESSVRSLQWWDANDISVASITGLPVWLRRQVLKRTTASMRSPWSLPSKYTKSFTRPTMSCFVKVVAMWGVGEIQVVRQHAVVRKHLHKQKRREWLINISYYITIVSAMGIAKLSIWVSSIRRTQCPQAHPESEYSYDSLNCDSNGKLVAAFAKFLRHCR